MSREDPQIKLRLTQAMKDKIQTRASRNKRSMNAEIVLMLSVVLDAEEPHEIMIKSELTDWAETFMHEVMGEYRNVFEKTLSKYKDSRNEIIKQDLTIGKIEKKKNDK